MSDGMAAVMGRIQQIKSAFGSSGASRLSGSAAAGFDQLLRGASSGADGTASTGAPAKKSTSSGTDPLERLPVTSKSAKATKKPGTSATDGVGDSAWPADAPKEAEAFKDEFIAASQATGVPVRILIAVSWAESAFNPDAESGVGAQGLMQLMPATAAGLGVDPSDPAQNIMGGAKYLAAQYAQFGSWDLAFAAYNAGPGAVQQYGGIPPYRETQNYVATINDYLDRMPAVAAPVVPSTAAATGGAASGGNGNGGPAAGGASAGGTTPGATPAGGVAAVPPAAAAQRAALEASLRRLGGATGSSEGHVGDPNTAVALGGASVSDPTFAVEPATTALDHRRVGAVSAPGGAAVLADPNASINSGAVAGTSVGAGTAAGATEGPRAGAEMTSTAAALPERLAALISSSRSDGQSSHRITVRLDPPDLGKLNVSFDLKGDQVHIIVRPERVEGGQLLSDQRDRIATLLAREGLELSGFDVGANSSGPGTGRQLPGSSRQYSTIDLDAANEVLLTVDRGLRL